MRPITGPHRPAPGYTLLELLAASTLLAVALVPSLGLLRDSRLLSGQVERANLMTTLCAGKLEEQLALTAAEFTSGTQTGTFQDQGFGELAFRVQRSDDPADGGLEDRLMALTVTVWHDHNGNGQQDADEPAVVFSTKVAQMAAFQELANGS